MRKIIFLILVSLILSNCGTTGKLYLPKDAVKKDESKNK
ncbi:MAG: lipoprotein [Alphaproteobacteria bacterium]